MSFFTLFCVTMAKKHPIVNVVNFFFHRDNLLPQQHFRPVLGKLENRFSILPSLDNGFPF